MKLRVEEHHKIHNLLTAAQSEILELRALIAAIEPKAQAYDAIVKVLGFVGNDHRAMKRDVVYDLNHFLEFELELDPGPTKSTQEKVSEILDHPV